MMNVRDNAIRFGDSLALAFLLIILAFATTTRTQCVPASTAAGALDTCFGTGGKVTTDITADRDFARALAIQPDGKIVVAGIAGYSATANNADFVVARYNVDGSLDTTFDGDGIVVTDFGVGTVDDDYCRGVVIQPDGKIVIAGRGQVGPSSYALAVVRYNTDGSLDTTFDGDGKAQFEQPAILEMYGLALQPDGKIIVGGRSFSLTTHTFTGLVVRFNSNGSLDTSFGSNGSTTASMSGVFSIALQTDGRIVAGGTEGPDATPAFAIARLNSDGGLDASFDGDGIMTTHPTTADQTWFVNVRSDNQIFLGGHSATNPPNAFGMFLRFRSNGGAGGGALYAEENAFWNMTFQPDWKQLTVGASYIPQSGYTIRRFIDVAIPDASFNGGAVYVKFLSASVPEASGVNAIAMTPDNKIVVAGSVTESNNTITGWRLAIARLYAGAMVHRSKHCDFDNDGKCDLSIFRPSVGEWWIKPSGAGPVFAAQFGTTTDSIVPCDLTGDGKTDIAIWRPSSGEWFVLRSEDFSYFSFPFGTTGDIPAPADYDGDGKADATVFRPSNSTWYVRRSSTGSSTIQIFGLPGDIPVPSDYDGDGRTDIAIFRPSNGQWWIDRSGGGIVAVTFGNSSDRLVPGDYTGDSKSDIALWRPSTGQWFILRSEDFSYYSQPWGIPTDIPAPGDYDGDGKFDATVFRPFEAAWYSQWSTSGAAFQVFGLIGDRPVPGAFVR